FHVSRVRPAFTFCSSESECGSGLPRETSRNSSCAVKYGSKLSIALASADDPESPLAAGQNPSAAAPVAPRRRKYRRVNSRCSSRKFSASFIRQGMATVALQRKDLQQHKSS